MVGVFRRTFLGAGLVAFPFLFGTGVTQAGQHRLTLGTGPVGATLLIYGGALLDAMKAVDAGLNLREYPTRGVAENVALLEKGEIDLGLVTGEFTHELFAGVGRPETELRVVAAMYPTPGMFAVKTDSRYREIDDLLGRPVVWNGRNSGLALQARYILDGLGLDLDKDFQAIYIEKLSEGPTLVLDGAASALWGGGLRWPGFVTLATSPLGARFVVPSEEQAEKILAKHMFLRRVSVPAGLYPGQHQPIESVGSWNFILARADLPEPVGYRLAANLNRIERGAFSPRQLGASTLRNTVAVAPSLHALHPGVVRYCREQGLMK
jgi:uncharacterized protein